MNNAHMEGRELIDENIEALISGAEILCSEHDFGGNSKEENIYQGVLTMARHCQAYTLAESRPAKTDKGAQVQIALIHRASAQMLEQSLRTRRRQLEHAYLYRGLYRYLEAEKDYVLTKIRSKLDEQSARST